MICSLQDRNVFPFPEAIKTQVDRRKTDQTKFGCFFCFFFLRSTKSKHILFFPLPSPPTPKPTPPPVPACPTTVVKQPMLLQLRLCSAEHWSFWGASRSGGTAPAPTSAREATLSCWGV